MPSLRLHLLLGALQGIALWLLYEAAERWGWLTAFPRALAALVCFSVVAPLAWYLTHGVFASERSRVAFAVLLGLLLAALGAHAAAVAGAERPLVDSVVFSFVIPAAVLAFLVMSLAGAWESSRRRFGYARLFELAWRNAVLAAVAAALTGGFWIVLAAGAWLMESIGLHGLRKLYAEPVFAIPVTAAALGLSFGLALARANILAGSRHVALSLAMWLLPVALGFAIAWVAALPFTGVQPLFSTGNAAFYLLWFGTLAIVFLNAAFQEGRDAPAYPRWLARLSTWAWLAMPVLAVLAGWALWERVAQHGWTPERIWAAVVWVVVTLCALGYAISAFRTGPWMHSVGATNIIAALLLVTVILALTSPAADVRRLAVSNQVARLRAGAVPLAQFDWDLLLKQTGRYGHDALQALARPGGADDATKAIATQAADVLRAGRSPSRMQDRAAALRTLRERVAVRPRGALPDAALLEWLARPNAEWHERNCISRPGACALWIVDLDNDRNDDALLLWDQRGSVQGALYSRASGNWRKEGTLRDSARPLSAWFDEIDAGRVSTDAPKWPDVILGGQRIRIGP